MKRLIYTLAALAMVTGACSLAQAEFLGFMHRDRDWNFVVNNNGVLGFTAVTVHYIGKSDKVETRRVDPGTATTLRFARPGRGTSRIIIDVDPPKGATVPVEVDDGVTSVPETIVLRGSMVFDVID
jgi:hypothetical protein